MTSRCALLPSIWSLCPQMTSDPLPAAEPVWGFHQMNVLQGFRKWHWLSDLAAFWLRLKLETWSGSARPPFVKELLFFLPTALNYWPVKGQYWAGRVFKPEVMSPVNQKENTVFSYGNFNFDSWHSSANVLDFRSRAIVSAKLQSSRMTQDFIWNHDWTFHWLHKTCFIWKHFT